MHFIPRKEKLKKAKFNRFAGIMPEQKGRICESEVFSQMNRHKDQFDLLESMRERIGRIVLYSLTPRATEEPHDVMRGGI